MRLLKWNRPTWRLSTAQEFQFWLAWSTVLWWWALAEERQREEGIASIRQGLATWQTIGVEIARPYALALLAEAYGKSGPAAEGLALLAEALTAVHNTGEQFYEAKMYRLQGELLLWAGVRSPACGSLTPVASRQLPDTEAEACFQQALTIARRQQARS